jgi:hypothetical protein
MKLIGSLTDYIKSVFKKDGFDITLQPDSGTTYSANHTVNLPPPDGDNDDTLVGEDATQTLTNKSISGPQIDSGTLPDARIQASGVTQHEASIDHDALTNFVANEHIDWTSTSSNLNTSGTADTGTQTITGNETMLNQGETRWNEQTGNGTNYMGLTAPDAVTTSTTLKLPDGPGALDQVLSTNGVDQLSWLTVSAGGLTPLAVDNTDSPVTVEAGIHYLADLSGGTIVFNAPAGVDEAAFRISDVSGASETNNATVNANGAETIDGDSSLIIDVNEAWVQFSWDGTEWVTDDPISPTTTGLSVVEFTYNTDTSNSNDTTSFRNGADGIAFASYSSAGNFILKRVESTTDISPLDNISLEVNLPSTNKWLPADIVFPQIEQGSSKYGIGLVDGGGTNQIDVEIGGDGATPDDAWSTVTTYKWRVKHHKPDDQLKTPLNGIDVSTISTADSTVANGTERIYGSYTIDTGHTLDVNGTAYFLGDLTIEGDLDISDGDIELK